MSDTAHPYTEIYRIVAQIPAGRVSSYGRIAALAGYPRHARLVGYALYALRNTADAVTIPWWRVVNASGQISHPSSAELQRHLLEAEGVSFNPDARIDLRRYLWDGN